MDKKYKETKLEDIERALSKMGKNEEMQKYGNVNLPIGKYYMSTYSYSLKEYIKFKNAN